MGLVSHVTGHYKDDPGYLSATAKLHKQYCNAGLKFASYIPMPSETFSKKDCHPRWFGSCASIRGLL